MLSVLTVNGPLSTIDLSRNIGVNISTIDNNDRLCYVWSSKRENDILATINSEEVLIYYSLSLSHI